MRSTSFVAFTLCALSTTVFSAPTPQFSNIIGSITNPGAGNDNIFKGIANDNGNENGNDNSAGNGNGNHNKAGNGNEAVSGNTFKFPSISKERRSGGYEDMLSGITNTIGSVTHPTAGSDNTFKDIANGNGNGNGNGNSAGNHNGNGNSAGNNNEALSGNTIDVSPNTALRAHTLPDINVSPTINLARSKDVASQS